MTKKHRNNDLTVRVRPEILEIQDTIIETRRDFHKYPELGFEVHRTAGIVSDRLNSFGLDVQTGIGKTGVVGTLQGKKRRSHHCVACRHGCAANPGNKRYTV